MFTKNRKRSMFTSVCLFLDPQDFRAMLEARTRYPLEVHAMSLSSVIMKIQESIPVRGGGV